MLATSGTCTTDQLADKVPEESARYHLFGFKHTHQGDYKESNGECGVKFQDLQEYVYFAVFIYSMPGYSVPIKERMMYSSCRNAVVDVIEKTLNIPLEKKVEVDSGSELTKEYLQVIFFLSHSDSVSPDTSYPRENCTQ